jgi:hypothetical protein
MTIKKTFAMFAALALFALAQGCGGAAPATPDAQSATQSASSTAAGAGDSDGDGIPDSADKCPDQKEDGQAPDPKDGCPKT